MRLKIQVWILRLKVWYGALCPEHLEPTYYDESYDKLRCSVTDQTVNSEWRAK